MRCEEFHGRVEWGRNLASASPMVAQEMSTRSAGAGTSERRINDQPPDLPDNPLDRRLFQPNPAPMSADLPGPPLASS
jgi:hypothetical protein